MFLETVMAAIIAFSVLLSTALFCIEVFVRGRWLRRGRRRGMSGQATGLVFSAIAVPLYFIAFSDKIPGHPIGLRDTLLWLPHVTKADSHFASSIVVLVALVVTYSLRLGIYTRLFVIPALTLPEAEYNKRENVEERANDLYAPGLAYLTFALTLTAIIAGSYSLPIVAGVSICLALEALYYLSGFLRRLEDSLVWITVQTRILINRLWLLISMIVIGAVWVLARLEMIRRQLGTENDALFGRLDNRIRETQLKTRERIKREQEILRNLARRDEQQVQDERVRNG